MTQSSRRAAFAGRQNLMPRGWNKFRDEYIRRNPVCAFCGQPSFTPDHIQPRSIGGSDDELNLQPLCEPCHQTKTAAEGHAAWDRKRAVMRAKFDTSDRHPSEY